MRASPALPPLAILCALLVLTGLNLAAAALLPPGGRGLAIAVFSAAKAALVVLGFMRLQRESALLAGGLVAYAILLCGLAGLRIGFGA